MRAYACGSADAFDRLFVRNRQALFTYLLHQTGDRDVAEDLFQEVFLRVVRSRAKYMRGGGFQAWLFTIARNTIIDHRRRAEVRSTVKSESNLGGMTERADSSQISINQIPSLDRHGDPVARAQLKALKDRLQEAILELPDLQREVFLLRERIGMDFDRIARVTGCRVATAKSRMRYALANLRRSLTQDLASLTECPNE